MHLRVSLYRLGTGHNILRVTIDGYKFHTITLTCVGIRCVDVVLEEATGLSSVGWHTCILYLREELSFN